MALKFNPFEKDKPAPIPQLKPSYNSFRPFDDPDRPIETGNKLGTNKEQTGNRTGNKQGTNREQTGNKLDGRKTLKKETGNKLGTEPGTNSETNREQTGNKLGTKDGFLALSGLQRETLLFIYFLCRGSGSRETTSIQLNALAKILKTTTGAAKETIKRLVKKSLLERLTFRTGRGGFSNYILPEPVYRQLFELESRNKLGTNREQTGNKPGTEPGTEPGTSSSSSSSSLDLDNFKTTTTSEPQLLKMEAVQLNIEWQSIDYSTLAEIGFTETHLVQVIRQGKLSSVEVQDSIHFFAFDLKRNGKGTAIHGSPLNFFMGILRRGQAYAPPDNFESPEAEARRKYLEGKRSLEAKRLVEEQELQTLEFTQWKRGLSVNDIAVIVPEYAQKRPGPIQDAALLDHFEKAIWPVVKNQVPGLGADYERSTIQAEISRSLEGAAP